MKKIAFLMTMVLCMMSQVYVYGDAQLNPYAYDVKAELSGTNIELSYKLNAPATSTDIIVYSNEVEVGRQQVTAVADNAAGAHTATVNLSSIVQAGNCNVKILVRGTSPAQPTQIPDYYAFWSPRGVAVDVNPNSSYFGRILTDESATQVPNSGYHSSAKKNGIYAFDAAFNPIYNGSDLAFQGGYTYSRYLKGGSSAGNAFAPNRIRISEDGRIFVSVMDDHYSSLYEVSADLQTWTPIFSGTFNNGVILDGEGHYVTGINCGFDVKGSGENLKLIMLNCNTSFGSNNPKDWMVATYNLGTASSWSGPASTADTLKKFIPSGGIVVRENCGITWDDVEGFWYIGNRANAIDQHALIHVNNAGTVDYELHKTAADSLLFSLDGNGLNGGGNARIMNGMFFIGTGQKATGTGHLQVFDITHGENNVPILTKKYEMNLTGIGRNLNDFGLDYANNLFTAGNNNEKIVAVALPYSGEVETPVVLPSNVVLPLVDHVYEIGSNQPGGWAPGVGTELTKASPNVFKYEAYLNVDTYFGFTTELKSTWDEVRPYRFSGASNNLVVANGDNNLPLYNDAEHRENAFKVETAGFYTITVDLNTMKMSVVSDPHHRVEIMQGWDSWKPVVMVDDVNGENYTATITIDSAAQYSGAIGFKLRIDNNSTWVGKFQVINRNVNTVDNMNDAANNCGLLADIAGEYEFTYTYATGAFEVSFPDFVRTAENTNYQSLCVPFNATISGATAYRVAGANNTEIHLTSVDALEAGHSYIIKPDAAGDITITYTSGDPTLTPAQPDGTGLYGQLVGDYVYNYDNETTWRNNYVLQDDNLFHQIKGDGAIVTVGPTRAYLHITGPENAPALRIVEVSNDATDIQSIEGQEKAVKFIENGRILILKDGVTYDAMGRIVR